MDKRVLHSALHLVVGIASFLVWSALVFWAIGMLITSRYFEPWGLLSWQGLSLILLGAISWRAKTWADADPLPEQIREKGVTLIIGPVMALVVFFVSWLGFSEAITIYNNPIDGQRDWLEIIIYTIFGAAFLFTGFGIIKTTARWFSRSRPQHEPTN